jgi:hypothetical protein
MSLAAFPPAEPGFPFESFTIFGAWALLPWLLGWAQQKAYTVHKCDLARVGCDIGSMHLKAGCKDRCSSGVAGNPAIAHCHSSKLCPGHLVL